MGIAVEEKPLRAGDQYLPSIPVRRIEYLDGLRALAALWVVLSHLWISQYGLTVHGGLFGLLTNGILYSHLAVDLFIVLSGFCLILPQLRPNSGPLGVVNFYLRRARRILPPFYCALALGILVYVATEYWNSGSVHLNDGDLFANGFMVQDALINRDIYNGPIWSVAVEWRIYFLFPAAVLLLRRYGRWSVVAAAGIAGYGLTALLMRYCPGMLLSCPWYLFLFSLGVCAGSVAYGPDTDRHPQIWPVLVVLSMALLAICLWDYRLTPNDLSTFGLHMPLIDGMAGLFTASALIVISCKERESKVARFLTWPPLTRLGVVSYSLYLTHMPVLNIMNAVLQHVPAFLPFSPMARVALLCVVGLPIILSLSTLFFCAIERPLLSRKRL